MVEQLTEREARIEQLERCSDEAVGEIDVSDTSLSDEFIVTTTGTEANKNQFQNVDVPVVSELLQVNMLTNSYHIVDGGN